MVGRSIQTYLYATMFFVTTLLISSYSYNASSFAMRHKLHLELLYTWKFYLKHRPHCTFVTSKTRLTPMKTKLSPVKTIITTKIIAKCSSAWNKIGWSDYKGSSFNHTKHHILDRFSISASIHSKWFQNLFYKSSHRDQRGDINQQWRHIRIENILADVVAEV